MARPAKSSVPAVVGLPFFQRCAFGLAWSLVLVMPLVFHRYLHEAFRLPKLVTAEALGLASLVCLTIAWAQRRLPEPPRTTWTAVGAALAPLLAVASLGLWTSPHPEHLRESLAAMAIGVAVAAAWALGFDRHRLERLLVWSVAPAVVLAVVGIGQFHGWFQPFALQKALAGSRLVVTSLAGNSGEFGAYLLLPALVAQWRLRVEHRRRPLWLVVLLILVYGQIASQTLTALAALVLGSASFWLLAVPPRRRGLAIGITAAAALLVALAAPPVRNRIATVSDGVTVGRLNAALSGRLDGWRVAGNLFAQHPLGGVGLGGFAPEFAPNRLALQAEGVAFFQGHREAFFANAHSEYLEWIAETGVPGLLALAFALWTLGRCVRRLGDEDCRRPFAFCALLSLAVLAAAYFPFRVPLLAYPMLLLLAWLLRAGSIPTEVES